MRKEKLKVLLVEDDRIEVLKLQRSIAKDLDNYELTLATNGKEAFERIEEDMPNLILLDLNMPDTNGIEFMQIMKGRDELLHIPVIILTTSNNERDIHECYKLGIAGYVIKPLKYEDYEAKIKAIFRYWSLNEFLNY
ncbi:response regulator [Polaribacter dokdonensis]|jgi:CheY-like chemotaxis protein|uniref:Response regulator receiver domain-containing protein n=1 Tax=Polaribacter dokdonensis DSW-5 TaxID=1300348 RepID=A0A0M9CHQ6_9FLAO|nr:response regulator [Polaribacter dokdonensis]KOY52861.1 Two-component system response regulator [Polaribacter dokdonensis DSW-5]SEE53538.1 Response regulator receiver domain-containing protein [Polaribacter dokdonensis DSW-5]